MDKECIENRFGMIAVRKGFIEKEAVFQALEIQVNEDVSKGEHRLIGRILLDEGLITRRQLVEVLQSLSRDGNRRETVH